LEKLSVAENSRAGGENFFGCSTENPRAGPKILGVPRKVQRSTRKILPALREKILPLREKSGFLAG
jgi:hypothetical protein